MAGFKLYEISDRFHALQEVLESGEVTEEMLKDAFADVEADFDEKVQNIAKMVRNYEAAVSSIAEEERRLATRKKSYQSKVDWLKRYVYEQMQSIGRERVDGILRVSRRVMPGKVVIVDESRIPEKYRKMESVILKSDLLRDLRSGNMIDGVELSKEEGIEIK